MESRTQLSIAVMIGSERHDRDNIMQSCNMALIQFIVSLIKLSIKIFIHCFEQCLIKCKLEYQAEIIMNKNYY